MRAAKRAGIGISPPRASQIHSEIERAEPETYAMMLAGLALLGFAGLRNIRVSAPS